MILRKRLALSIIHEAFLDMSARMIIGLKSQCGFELDFDI